MLKLPATALCRSQCYINGLDEYMEMKYLNMGGI